MQLISNEYCKLNVELHDVNRFYGVIGLRHADKILELADKIQSHDILDYGCGKSTLARNLDFSIKQYDPAIEKYSHLPEPSDIVVCTDVLEHIEPPCLDDVLTHLASLTLKVGFFTACTIPAKKQLSDGRNAHLIVESAQWWVSKLMDYFDVINFTKKDSELVVIVEPLKDKDKKENKENKDNKKRKKMNGKGLPRIFIGYDHRQPVSYNVLAQSIFSRSSKPVAITPLVLPQLPLKRVGLTPFTFTRFLVPYLCDYEGWALFLDIDMLVRDDISKLFNLAGEKYAVMCSKNRLRFEWASALLFNNSRCKILTPEYIETASNLHGIGWVKDEEIGDLPREWNHLIGYDNPRSDAKLVHYTQGIPCFPETQTSEYADEWHKEHQITNFSYPWVDLMGNSVHACDLDGKRVPKFVAGIKE